MKVVLLNKSMFVRLPMLYERKEASVKYSVARFSDRIPYEIGNKTELGMELKRDLSNKRRLSDELQKSIWRQLFMNVDENLEILFVNQCLEVDSYKNLFHVLNDMHFRYEEILDLYLDEEDIVRRARQFSEQKTTTESIPVEEFINKVLMREKERLNTISGLSKITKVKSIYSGVSIDELEHKVWETIL
ncbi:MAG: hypothetical protein ACRBG0_25525 [Lewinella sp.]|uniref:hypothetical protein n=1 Tax=Lewinella sp. TaxID=2004506 RepID=UPI003D6C275F